MNKKSFIWYTNHLLNNVNLNHLNNETFIDRFKLYFNKFNNQSVILNYLSDPSLKIHPFSDTNYQIEPQPSFDVLLNALDKLFTNQELIISSYRILADRAPFYPDAYRRILWSPSADLDFNWDSWLGEKYDFIMEAICEGEKYEASVRFSGIEISGVYLMSSLSFILEIASLRTSGNLIERFVSDYEHILNFKTYHTSQTNFRNILLLHHFKTNIPDQFELNDETIKWSDTVITDLMDNNIVHATLVFGDQYFQTFETTVKYNFNSKIIRKFEDAGEVFLIVTDRETHHKIKRSSSFKFLSSIRHIFQIVDDDISIMSKSFDKYRLSHIIFACLVSQISKLNASLVIIPPDALFAENWFDLINKGHKIELCSGIRCDKEQVFKEIENINRPYLTTKTLNRLRYNYAHELTLKSKLVNTDGEIRSLPTILFAGTNYKKHLFGVAQMHPLYVPNQFLRAFDKYTIASLDGNFLTQIVPNQSDISNFAQTLDIFDEREGPLFVEVSDPIKVEYDKINLLKEGRDWFFQTMNPINAFSLNASIQQVLRDKEKLENEEKTLVQFASLVIQDFSSSASSLKNSGLSQGKEDIQDCEQKKPGMIFSLPIWGDKYIKHAEEYLFPNLLNPIALKTLNQNYSFDFIISTSPKYISKISTILEQYDFGNGDFYIFPQFNDEFDASDKYSGKKYNRVSEAQSFAISIASQLGHEYFVPLYADFVCSKNFIEVVDEQINSGSKYFLSLVPPIITEQVENIRGLKNIKLGSDIVEDEHLNDIYEKALHPLFTLSIHGYHERDNPIGPYIGLGSKNSFAVKSCHYHPVYLKLDKGIVMGEGTIDEQLIPSLEMSYLDTDFNDFKKLKIFSLMDSDFPLPSSWGASIVRNVFNLLMSAKNREQMSFLLNNTLVIDLGPSPDPGLELKITRLEKQISYFRELLKSSDDEVKILKMLNEYYGPSSQSLKGKFLGSFVEIFRLTFRNILPLRVKKSLLKFYHNNINI